MRDVVVVGAGVVGASVAFRLARSGAQVTLIEAKTLAAGTSSATTGWTNASRKAVHEYFLLSTAGMAEHRRLRQEFGSAPWFHENGNLEWAESEAEDAKLEARVQRLQGWGYPAEWLTRKDVSNLEQGLILPPRVERFVHFPTEGHVDTPLLIGRLVREAIEAGASVRTGCRVASLALNGGRVEGVTTESGQRVAADAVVNCAGPWAAELLHTVGLDCPMAPSVGLIAVSTPTPVGLRGNVHTPILSLQGDSAGRVMMRGEIWDKLVDSATPEAPVPEACNAILAEAAKVVRGLAEAKVEAARIGVRPCPTDKLPAIGSLPGADGLYLATMHSGVTMGPLIGRLLATEITTGVVDPRLTGFRPDRFSQGGARHSAGDIASSAATAS